MHFIYASFCVIYVDLNASKPRRTKIVGTTMFTDLVVTFFQAAVVNVLLGCLMLQVNVLDVVKYGFTGMSSSLQISRKIYRVFTLGVLIKTFIDFTVYNSFLGIGGKGREEIFNDVLKLALLLSPLNLLWTRRCGLASRKFRRDLAVGLASSYIYGYLKKIGPLFSDSIKESQDYFGDRFPSVLLILVPKNGVVLDQLSDADPRIRFKGNSKTIYIDYSGIYQRPYHFSLYEIVTEELTIRCCLEYASALRVLEEMRDMFGFEEKELNEIVMTFYEDVKENLDSYRKLDQQVEFLLFSGEREDMVNAIKEQAERDAGLMHIVKQIGQVEING